MSDSLFDAHFDTNYCPTDHESRQIRALLVEPRIRLHSLDAAIQKLEQERAVLLAHIAKHEALLSPIRRLPHDMLQEIFKACMPADRNIAMSSSEPPLVLSRICSRWRNIALGTPMLWSKLHVVEPAAGTVVRRTEAVKEWLGRTGSLPLSISFAGMRQKRTNDVGTVAFLTLLATYISRWEQVDLKFALDPRAFQVLANLPANSAPLLRKININCTSLYPSPKYAGAIPFADHAAQYSVQTDGCGVGALKIWGSVTQLHLQDEDLSEQDMLQTLAALPRLRSLQLAVWIDDGFLPGIALLPVVLPLDRLEIDMQGPGFVPFLQHLSCPALRHLTIRGLLGNTGAQQLTTLAAFLSTSPELTSLDLDLSRVSRPIIALLPQSLRRLTLMGHRRSALLNVFDDLLTHAPPHLRELRILQCGRIAEHAMKTYLEQCMGTLKCLRLEYYCDVLTLGADAVVSDAALKPFRDAGLDVVVKYPKAKTVSPFHGLQVT
ncbi:F-box domain-containing protein [Mycena chlorophos]|uniref:F-box domain-containing protein n=1 Tax=Mycena chlorophos TaxID=658473 RepID=A0A8H6VZS8_MYCCL|nr:F-box domain-containing protein [Mycena chlorophos]